MSRVIIIGAGIGGLATANLLAASGHDVTIYETHEGPGGRAGRLKIDGFTFDTGPSWYLMPEVFADYFKLLGEDIHDYLQLTRLDPAYQIMFENGSEAVRIHADLERDRRTFDLLEPGAGNKLEQYLHKSGQTYDLALQHFLYTNFESPRSLLHGDVLKSGSSMLASALRPIHGYVGKYFKDLRLQQIMEYPMVFLGTSPYQAPALYSLMSHMDFTQGVFYPQGGLFGIIEALEAVGRKHGVSFQYNQPVKSIVSKDKKATGVVLADGTEVTADIVISNADLHYTETELLQKTDRSYSEKYWNSRQVGPSAILMYLGVKGKLPQLEHHNLIFADKWQESFETIYKGKQWPEPASMYICRPSATDSSVAPEGHENLFVLVPGPASLAYDPRTINDLAEKYLDQFAAMAKIPDLRERLVVKRFVGPHDFANDFNSWNGTALGLSHVLRQSAIFRPRNKSRKLSNLYYAGANTVPGIGLPMCLIGAQLVYKRLNGDKSAGPLRSIK